MALRDYADAQTATAYSVAHQLVGTAWGITLALILVLSVFGWTNGRAIVMASYEKAKQHSAKRSSGDPSRRASRDLHPPHRARRVPRQRRRDGRGAHDRARRRGRARLAVDADRRCGRDVVLLGSDRGLRAALGSIPIDTLRFVVGALLLVFGLQWLRKAILRSSGYKELHDEDAAFREQRAAAAAAGDEQRAGVDWYSFTVSFKGVLLEGLEVVFIVISFGAGQGRLGRRSPAPRSRCCSCSSPASSSAARSSACPRTRSSSSVGLMLTSFGCFWAAEGAGVHWPGDELVADRRDRVLRRRLVRLRAGAAPPPGAPVPAGRRRHEVRPLVRALLVGLHRRRRLAGAVGVAAGLGLTAAFEVWWLLPPVVAVVLFASLRRAARA